MVRFLSILFLLTAAMVLYVSWLRRWPRITRMVILGLVALLFVTFYITIRLLTAGDRL